MTKNPGQKNLKVNQNGLVSIFSVLIIMGIITLLTIGFTRVVRQAQYRVLNEQLNTQALYAAETAINDARKVIEANASNLSAAEKSDCAPNASYPNSVLDSTLGIEYTCVLVDTTPINNEYDNLSDPVVNIINRQDGNNINRVLVQWDSVSVNDPVGNNTFTGGNPNLPTAAAWNTGIGMVRVDLIPVSDLSRAGMINNGYTFFLIPTTNASGTTSAVTIPPGVNEQGTTVLTRCDSTGAYRCVQELVLGGPSLSSYYYRIQSLYRGTSAAIGVTDGGPSNTVELIGGQAEIDTTGSASGVFKRIRARIPIETNYEFDQGFANEFALLSGQSICKRIVSASGFSVIDGSGSVSCPTTIP